MKVYEHNIQLVSKSTLVSGNVTNKITGSPIIADVVFYENNRMVKTVTSDDEGN